MRKSLLQTSLLCGSLVMLSGCYSNGKFHSPTWGDMAWWRKDNAPDTSLAAAPSVGGRPSEEALADKGSPGAKAGMAPPYDAAAASYNQPPSGDSRYPTAGYPNSAYPNTGYPDIPASPSGQASPTGGSNWAANGDRAAASMASNPYAKSAAGYDTGSRYDGRAADHAQTTPYDSSYPGGNRGDSGDSGNVYSKNYALPTGPRDNPYYGDDASSPATGSRQYDEGRYTAPDRYAPAAPYAPSANDGASAAKYASPNYVSPQDAQRRYNAEGYRDITGDRYQTDSARATPPAQPPASSLPNAAPNARTADARNNDHARGNGYQPGDTGYQPAGVPDYSVPGTEGSPRATSSPYAPGGTSRYESSTGGTTSSTANGSPYGTNPYAEPLPTNRYQEPPATSRDGAARY